MQVVDVKNFCLKAVSISSAATGVVTGCATAATAAACLSTAPFYFSSPHGFMDAFTNAHKYEHAAVAFPAALAMTVVGITFTYACYALAKASWNASLTPESSLKDRDLSQVKA